MALLPAPMTELQAVNILLDTIGEEPLNSLTGESIDDAARAQSVLLEVSREIQSQGWYFNTEYDVPLTRLENGKIPVPNNAASIDVNPFFYTQIEPIRRGSFMYDLKNRTDTFDTDLKATIVYYMAFENIPETARYYITLRAARKFANRVAVSRLIYQFSREDEDDARSAFIAQNELQADRSFLNSPGVIQHIGRRPVRRT